MHRLVSFRLPHEFITPAFQTLSQVIPHGRRKHLSHLPAPLGHRLVLVA